MAVNAISIANAELSNRTSAVNIVSNAASNALSAANAASNAASNALSVANAASNAVSNEISNRTSAINVVSNAASNALSVANAASNLASRAISLASIVSTTASNLQSAISVLSQQVSVLSQSVSVVSAVAAGNGMEKLASANAVGGGGVATIDITGLTTSYTSYLVVITNCYAAVAGSNLYLRTSTNGGVSYDASVGNYKYHTTIFTGGATSFSNSGSAAQMIILDNVSGSSQEGAGGTVWLFDPAASYAATAKRYFKWEFGYEANGSGIRSLVGGGCRAATTDVDAIRFIMSSGNIGDGVFQVYGLK